LKNQVLFYSAYAGLFKSLWFGLYDIFVLMVH